VSHFFQQMLFYYSYRGGRCMCQAVLCLFSKEIIEIVFGSKYAQSVRALSIISWAIIPLSMDMFFNNILIVMNKQRYTVIYGGLTLATNFFSRLYIDTCIRFYGDGIYQPIERERGVCPEDCK
jgi:hypothetical protein